jgi:hypothetical protein
LILTGLAQLKKSSRFGQGAPFRLGIMPEPKPKAEEKQKPEPPRPPREAKARKLIFYQP